MKKTFKEICMEVLSKETLNLDENGEYREAIKKFESRLLKAYRKEG